MERILSLLKSSVFEDRLIGLSLMKDWTYEETAYRLPVTDSPTHDNRERLHLDMYPYKNNIGLQVKIMLNPELNAHIYDNCIFFRRDPDPGTIYKNI